MSARENILARLRRAMPPVAGGGDRAAAVKARLASGQVAPVPEAARTEGKARIERFIAKAEAVDTTVSRVPSFDALPEALAGELRGRNLPAAIRTGTDPVFDRDWGTVERTTGPGRLEEPATLSRAECAMAETGTLVLASGPQNPVTLTFLGETHFVAIRASDICAGFEDMWAAWRIRGLDPRTVNLVTGPSRSADIGQTLQLGAHGPVALHIFVVEE